MISQKQFQDLIDQVNTAYAALNEEIQLLKEYVNARVEENKKQQEGPKVSPSRGKRVQQAKEDA